MWLRGFLWRTFATEVVFAIMFGMLNHMAGGETINFF